MQCNGPHHHRPRPSHFQRVRFCDVRRWALSFDNLKTRREHQKLMCRVNLTGGGQMLRLACNANRSEPQQPGRLLTCAECLTHSDSLQMLGNVEHRGCRQRGKARPPLTGWRQPNVQQSRISWMRLQSALCKSRWSLLLPWPSTPRHCLSA